MKPQLSTSFHGISGRGHLTQLARRLIPVHPPVVDILPGWNPGPTKPCALRASHATGTRGISSIWNPRPLLSLRTKNCSTLASKTAFPRGEPRQIPQSSADPSIQLQSSISPSIAVLALVSLTGVVAFICFHDASLPTEPTTPPLDRMSSQIPEGRPGNLTPEQEEKLRKLWASFLNICGNTESIDALSANDAPPSQAGTETAKKKRFGVFRRNHSESKPGGSSPLSAESSVKVAEEDDKYGQTKQFQETLARHSPERIREAIWTMVKHDHPDALVLRFLRARKWDVDKALVMMVSTLNWRLSEMRLDDDIMKNGEAKALMDEKDENADIKKSGHDFLEQMRLGKSFLHNTDKKGRPICNVRVRLHRQGEQSEESLERYTVYLIETTRMILSPPVDTATIIFDMTGFSMANMDYPPVKFMIKCFEANYPESLGAVLVHNSPWLFQGIWKVIRGWLDPVVAGKVHFTNNRADLEEFIEPANIIKELGGDEDWEYKYIEPVPGENDKMQDSETRDKLLASKEEIVKQFEAATVEWIKNPDGENAKATKAARDTLAGQLRDNYWKLDPYVRARSLYDRQGILQPGGKVAWGEAKAPAASKPSAPETSVDDLD